MSITLPAESATRASSRHSSACMVATQRGFTLIELIMVIVILGVLAVFAAPRMFNSGDFNARGFHDETLAYLRYAQKTAIAQRHTVCVTFTSTTQLTLSIAADSGVMNCAFFGTLVGPKGDSGASIALNAKSGAAYVSQPTNFNFDSAGQPLSAATGVAIASQTSLPAFAVAGTGLTITVEVGTGYVHE